ncbi:midasin, putative [Babesia caballi]|uniref:Midasin n=1 Tax=Babesia caballi TaxID=5871 RepID=A0AAV4LQH9_BABCB|nr:midasin, putative [Babesia caballi]
MIAEEQMEYSSQLSAYCTHLANALSSSCCDTTDFDINEVCSRLDSISRSWELSPSRRFVPCHKGVSSSILKLYGNAFYCESAFRRLASACALGIARDWDRDVSVAWRKLQFVTWSCLLNPCTSSDVVAHAPAIALSLVADFISDNDASEELLLERLTLLWRLRRDARLRIASRRAFADIINRAETSDAVRMSLRGDRSDGAEVSQYKLWLLRNLDRVLTSSKYREIASEYEQMYGIAVADKSVAGVDHERGGNAGLTDLHISVSDCSYVELPHSNLVRVGKRVSYLRYPDVTHDDAFVELDYSLEVLASMLCHLDASVGSVVSGECCKEFYIRELANRVGVPHDRIRRIYTDETTDVKSLVGQWICTEKVGEFKFSYGILSTAMRRGHWLIFDENLSESIGCLLHSVCQQGRLTITELNEVVDASSNFHVFVTTKNTQTLSGSLKHLPRTHVPELSEEDCVEIASRRWDVIAPIAASVVAAFFSLRARLTDHRGFNMSDLFKIFNRLATSGVTFDGYLSSATRGVILESFYCVVLAGISYDRLRESILGDVGEMFGIPRSSCSEVLPLSQIKESDNTRVHLKVLHQMMSCYLCNEPVLLVGETGTGKTAIVQHFAKLTGNTLKVYVFSEQSEAEDLIGSFFPDNIADVCADMFGRALRVLLRCCAADDLLLCYLDHLADLFKKGLYARFMRTLAAGIGQIGAKATDDIMSEAVALRGECNLHAGSEPPVKQSFKLSQLQQPLDVLTGSAATIHDSYTAAFRAAGPQLQFKFEEGLLIRAMREGWWILLDEINLAPSDLLQRFVGILSRTPAKFELYECGSRVVDIHENFRLFACMNPPIIRKGDFVTFTSGKKELPANFRSQMTEIFVDEIETVEDVAVVVRAYADDRSVPSAELCHFYLKARELCREGALEDGCFKSPTFTLRNLVRTLNYMHNVMRRSHRAVKDGREAFVDAALSCFASSLGEASFAKVEALLPAPPQRQGSSFEESVDYVRVEGYWIRRGGETIRKQEHFIVTPNISKSLRRLCRVLSGLRVPVLLEGPTAAGKTSMVQYLCALTGHRCVRINNHEHTDLSEYLGQFVFDAASRQLKFNYGPIVTAMKEGHWVILDELNLAPSQILEALNRILDDNREVYVPETGETIRSHPEFMIFATQNPANSIYGGRKQLSKAFCNRFVQLYIEGLGAADLQQVLHQRCAIPLSRAEKIVATFQSLQSCPMNSMAFERHSVLITLRDLIKWANRVRDDDAGLAYYGWCVIAEKLRDPADQEVVRGVLERCCLLSKPTKPKQLVVDFAMDASLRRFVGASGLSMGELFERERYLWFEGTTNRLLALLLTALENREPVLLVGETGVGKTTVCQLLAKLQGRRLNILNLSKNSEASDFIGSFRPIRGLKSFHTNLGMLVDYFEGDVRCPELVEYLRAALTVPLAQVDRVHFLEIMELVSGLLDDDGEGGGVVVGSEAERGAKRQKMKISPDEVRNVVDQLLKSFSNALFEWVDGPLTCSMERGEWFLADEISLADDAVLEKMNSVLEAESTLTIPEAGGSTLRVLRAHGDFRFLATMNPSGDHGKRELSPALLNRFTVIYIPSPDFENFEAMRRILGHYGAGQADWVAHAMAEVVRLHNARCPQQRLTLRDVIKWSEFMGANGSVDAFVRGAHVVFLDNMAPGSAGVTLSELLAIVSRHQEGVDVEGMRARYDDGRWVHGELARLEKAPLASMPSFTLGSRTSLCVVGKILRALEVDRPILLEGEPGVGKSASISALAGLYDTRLVRVNLSEHTDVMDLFGSDVPSVVDGNWKFVWSNGPVIDAAVNGYWVVLDELNLASQQVLEGLNALLDHRRETFIPELDRFIKCHENFRLFASQNSAVDGGGRKHLPKSFLNRFTKIYVPPLGEADCCAILGHLYRALSEDTVSRVVATLYQMRRLPSGRGWEWNLRDCLRFCDALAAQVPSDRFEAAFRFAFMSRLDSRDIYESVVSSMGISTLAAFSSRVLPFDWVPSKDCSDMDVDGGANLVMEAAAGENGTSALTVSNSCDIEPIWMQSQEEVCHTVCMAASLNFPVLLVGPGLSGKQSAIRAVSSRCGQPLVEITMLPCFDTSDLLGGFEQVGGMEGGSSAGSFRWVDSPLVEAIERGRWVLLTRIHNANPAILDRLNSLLEVNGSLALNESGNCDRVVRPHPNFRIFMTADGRQVGRLSRAFRNRCMEVHMDFPAAVRPPSGERLEAPFMVELRQQISDYLASMPSSGEESRVEQPVAIDLKCSVLIDGARLVKMLRGCTWSDCAAMSLCSGVVGSYLTQRFSGAYSHAGWLFLKHWCMVDQLVEASAFEASRFFPLEYRDTAFQVLERCFEWLNMPRSGAVCDALQLVCCFLERCTRFDDRLERDAVVAGFDLALPNSDAALWFMLRSTAADYDARYGAVERKFSPAVPRHYLDAILRRYLDNTGDLYEIHAMAYVFLFDSLRYFDIFGDGEFGMALVDRMVRMVSRGESAQPVLARVQFLLHLLARDARGIPETVHYVSQNVVAELLDMEDADNGLRRKHSGGFTDGDFVDHPVSFIGRRICSEVALGFELHRMGMGSLMACSTHFVVRPDANVRAAEVLDFVNACVQGEDVSKPIGSGSSSSSGLIMRHVESPNAAISKFVADRLRFLGCWLCHQFLVGEMDRKVLHKVHEYAVDLLKLHVELQSDLPSSSLAVVASVLVSLRRLMAGEDVRSSVYDIMLDSWAVSDVAGCGVDLDPVRYMVDIVNGGEQAARKGDETVAAPPLETLNAITGVMCFWGHVSAENGLPSLQANLRRIEALRHMLMEHMPAPQWSGLFAALSLVSPIVCRVINVDSGVMESGLRCIYLAITRDEPVVTGIFDAVTVQRVMEHSGLLGGKAAKGEKDSNVMVQRLSVQLIRLLMDLCESSVALRVTLLGDLWRVCGLLLLTAMPNTGMVIAEVRERLERAHRSELRGQLGCRLDTFVTSDTLSDGECCNEYRFLTERIANLGDEGGDSSCSLRVYVPEDGTDEAIGSMDVVALMRSLRSDLGTFVAETLKVGPDLSVRGDSQTLLNFRRYLLRQYVTLPEIVRPVMVGLTCLAHGLGSERSKAACGSTGKVPLSVQDKRVHKQCLQFPLNLLKRVAQGDLLSLGARFYDAGGPYDIYCYLNCLVSSLRLELLRPASMEPLKYAMLLVSGISSRLKIERAEGQTMRMSLLQSCIATAQRNVERGVHDLFPSQQEIIRAIVKDLGPLEEYESLEPDEEVVTEPEQNRELRQITAICKRLTVAVLSQSRLGLDVDCGSCGTEPSDVPMVDMVGRLPSQSSITRQMNAALCLGLVCAGDAGVVSTSDEGVFLSRRLMCASEEHFGYGGDRDKDSAAAFYRTVDVACCLKVWEIMVRLSERVKQLLAQFDRQQQLLDIDSMLSSMSRVKLPTLAPVLLVTLLENLVARVHKWNSISHSGISLRDLAAEAETLILDLRRRELKGWYAAIEGRLEAFREDAYGCLVYFTDMCSDVYDANVTLTDRVSNSVGEILQFALEAPVAHFGPTLDMLKVAALLYRDSKLPTEATMRCALENMLEFLELWRPAVEERIAALKEEARREIGELVKRINWSGNDYISIRALLQKQKAQLSSTLRRFQEGLAQPWSAVYAAAPVKWISEVDDTGEVEQGMNSEVSGDNSARESSLLETLRSNIDYVQANKNEISRVQITRITGEVGRMLSEVGYNATPGHDAGDWLRWLDFGASMRSKGCAAVEDARMHVMRALHIIFDLHESFRRDKDRFEHFSRNVDTNIFGYLVTLLRAAHANMVADVVEYEHCVALRCMSAIVGHGPVYELDRASFHQLLSVIDDVYETALQANDKDILGNKVCDVQSSDGSAVGGTYDVPSLLISVSEFRSWLEASSEMSVFNCDRNADSAVLVSSEWLDSLRAFFEEVSRGAGYPAPAIAFFQRDSSRAEALLAAARPVLQLPVVECREFKCKDADLPLACLYMAQLIDCISRVEPPAEEGQQETRDEWAAGTGLEDGTGAKNVSDEVDPEEGMFDNFKNESAPDRGDVSGENPSVDIDMEFEGDVLDLEASRECSDIEENENGARNEDFEDLQKQQLDEELVDSDPPLEGDGESMDIEGVSMEDTKDKADDVEGGQVDEPGRDNNYGSEVDQQKSSAEPESQPAEEDAGGVDDGLEAEGEHPSGEEATADGTSDPDPSMDLEDDLEVDDKDDGDTMEIDEGGEEGNNDGGDDEEVGEAADDEAVDEDGASPDKEPQARKRKEYEETPYGTEGETGNQIQPDDRLDVGGGSYEEDAFGGSFLGETSHSRGDGMLSFLDTIQRLESPTEPSGGEDLKLKHIRESMSNGQNRNENESILNELDESSNMEGVSASMDGSVAPTFDLLDVSNVERGQQEGDPTEVSDVVDPQKSGTEARPRPDNAVNEERVTDTEYESVHEVGIDMSGVLSGSVAVGAPVKPQLPSQASRSGNEGDRSVAAAMWRQYRDATSAISTSLCEQMRMILEPSLKSSLQGDYKTGKRISIKKLMAFIASNYQRDKIWLRRSKPSKRDYRVVLAIDNSRSMAVSNAGGLALKAFACIYQAMSVLEVGDLSVCKFGGDVPELLLEMDGGEDPSRVVAGMTFDEESHHSHETGLPELLKYVLRYLERRSERRKILVIISDGKFNKEKARPWIQATISNQVVPLLVILDPNTSGHKSILQMKQVKEIDGRLTVETFLSNFPFPYYAVIQNLDRLPNILSDLLRLRRIFTDEESGTNPLNYDGGNIGAYYNFMYPDNDDYPWSCVCSEKDFQLYQEKKMPYVRCRNQEDLSFHDFQANCDPKNSSNKPY